MCVIARTIAGLTIWTVIAHQVQCASLQSQKITNISETEINELLRNLEKQSLKVNRLVRLVNQVKHELYNCNRNSVQVLDIEKQLEDILHINYHDLENTYGIKHRESEHLRRRIENGVQQFWFHQKSRFEEILKQFSFNTHLVRSVDSLRNDTEEHYRLTMSDVYGLSKADDSDTKRKAELDELSDIIQHRFKYVQNPIDCKKAKKLLCTLTIHRCGLGCMVHRLADCLLVAYATKRTVVINSITYMADKEGWATVFQPFSETCTVDDVETISPWGEPDAIADKNTVELNRYNVANPRPDYMARAIPEDFADELIRLHGQPSIWWMGQLIKYIMRLQPIHQEALDNTRKREKFQHPIVGVHIRRTDKAVEAAFYEVEEYMLHVEEYYKLLSTRQTVDVKTVYLATEKGQLLEEIRTKYPEYTFISNTDEQFVEVQSLRESEYMVQGIAIDVLLLAETDFLVCTFSSNVCRLAFELMQTIRTGAENSFYSLDSGYFVVGQSAHQQRSLYDHPFQDVRMMSMHRDELMELHYELDGHVRGYSRQQNRTAYYYRYMVEDVPKVAQCASYEDIDALRNK